MLLRIEKKLDMKKGNLISIIIPVFNVKPYVVEALKSAVYQAYDNLEIIIIDDGSDDGSAEICDEYAQRDHRIFVIHQQNRGLSGARNSGLDFAKGDMVAFLDSDDAFDPDFIRRMVSAMIQERADVVVCWFSVCKTTGLMERDEQHDVRMGAEMGTYNKSLLLRAFAEGSIRRVVWNKLYRRQLWNQIRFPVGHTYEDIDTLFKVLNKCDRCYVIGEPLYRYRIREGSIVNTPSWEHKLDYIRAHAHLDSFIGRNTPEIFNVGLRNHRYEERLDELIYLYMFYPDAAKHETGISSGNLRRMIIRRGQSIDMSTFQLRTKAAYRLICVWPGLLRLLYPVYYFIHAGYRKVSDIVLK